MTDYPQPPPPYPGPQYPPPPQPMRMKNGVGTAGFVCGLLGIIFAWIPIIGVIAWPLVIVGLILSWVGLNNAKKGKADNKGLAIAGIACSVIGLLICIIWASAFANAASKPNPIAEGLNAAPKVGNSYVAPPPTKAFTAAAPAPAPPAPPQVFEGTGDDVIDVKPVTDVAILTFECGNCRGNVVVKTNGSESLLVNEIGAYTGQHLINARSTGSMTTQIQVNAKGKWKLTLTEGLDSAAHKSEGAPVSGKGDAVVVFRSNASKADVTYKGDQNFVVMVYSADSGSDLAVNEIGSYSGKVLLDGPAVVQVESSGDWTIAPS